MSIQRDFILRLIEQLREFLSQIVKLRTGGQLDEALVAIINAQERLFLRPAPEFIAQPPEEQFRLLTFAERVPEARAKCLMQVDLLSEAARVYADRELVALAQGAWQYALELAELTKESFPDAEGISDKESAAVRIENIQRELALLH